MRRKNATPRHVQQHIRLRRKVVEAARRPRIGQKGRLVEARRPRRRPAIVVVIALGGARAVTVAVDVHFVAEL